MSSENYWAMLAARGVQPGRPGGGTPTLTPAAIARGLQGLEPGPFLMGMACNVGDVLAISKLEIVLTDAIRGLYHRRFAPHARRVAGLAVFEVLTPRPLPCSTCNARGYITVDHADFPCLECGQTGGLKLSARTRAELADIAWSTWREGWDRRYEEIHSFAHGWYSEADSHLARNIPALLARQESVADRMRTAYHWAKNGARQRGIGWEFTFEEWRDVWVRSGRFDQRGTKAGEYCMARKWDRGPYASWNVEIQTVGENHQTAHLLRKFRRVGVKSQRVRDRRWPRQDIDDDLEPK